MQHETRVRALNIVLEEQDWTDVESSNHERLRCLLVRGFPALRPVERSRFVMSAPLANMVLGERKFATIRYEPQAIEYPTAAVLPLFVVDPGKSHDEAEQRAALRILSVGYKPVARLNDEDARKDGFSTRQELIDTLERFYGRLGLAEIVCIYSFELVDKDMANDAQASASRTIPPRT